MKYIFLLLAYVSSLALHGQVLTPRQQAQVVDEILNERINHLLPGLMKKAGIDMWVLISREYNEDPVLKTFLPATWLSARRRTMLVFYRNGQTQQFEKLAIARYNVGSAIEAAWQPEKQPDQWAALIDIINTRKPQHIGLNFSDNFGHADGLTHTEYQQLLQRLSPVQQAKITSAEKLAVSWLETRTQREMEIYPQLVQITHNLIAEAFSEKVITPGITTTNDVVWWFRTRFAELGLSTWFHPSVEIQRSDSLQNDQQKSGGTTLPEEIIHPGDLLHCDVGITYLRLNTDVQQHAYVLRPAETAVPANLQRAFENAQQVQNMLIKQFKTGVSGNQMLAAALQAAKNAGIRPTIYTHPLGSHGHAAGTVIGMWDQQGGVAGPGDYLLSTNTVYSIELNATTFISEWNKDIKIMLEEDGYWNGEFFNFISGRQKQILTIPHLAAANSN